MKAIAFGIWNNDDDDKFVSSSRASTLKIDPLYLEARRPDNVQRCQRDEWRLINDNYVNDSPGGSGKNA